ncbi:hypothetical protein C1Y40_03669 [Mycobacterium talmoniae]|uniref:Uncharacterized protein n=1 Tax=Mycobacterium talmoniae TaxID=1858794 RepID=A0A2S8BHM4_9MYCO|nr:hypothetical protein C1Y40_03669 [Mycobacterium talmoniae]
MPTVLTRMQNVAVAAQIDNAGQAATRSAGMVATAPTAKMP